MNHAQSKGTQPGFTLVELIIVITIVSIISSVVFVAVDPSRRLNETRNSRRSSNVSTILKAVRRFGADKQKQFPRIDSDPATVEVLGTCTSQPTCSVPGVTVASTCLNVYGSAGTNYTDSSTWTVNNGSVGIFNAYGAVAENVRETGTNPHSESVVLWKAFPNPAGSADGGWNTNYFSIDHLQMYRFTVWIKKTGSNGGTTYLGTNGGGAAVTTLAGTANSNPYFWNGDLPQLDTWYLVVGYIHASNDPSTTSIGGVYDMAGQKVLNGTDFKFQTTTTTVRHRAYLASATATDLQYYWDPRVEVVDGTEPTITALVTNAVNDTLNEYIKALPRDPSTGSDTDSRYYINRDANGLLTVGACDEQGEGPGGQGNVPVIEISG